MDDKFATTIVDEIPTIVFSNNRTKFLIVAAQFSRFLSSRRRVVAHVAVQFLQVAVSTVFDDTQL